jgi:hypothetical protein
MLRELACKFNRLGAASNGSGKIVSWLVEEAQARSQQRGQTHSLSFLRFLGSYIKQADCCQLKADSPQGKFVLNFPSLASTTNIGGTQCGNMQLK